MDEHNDANAQPGARFPRFAALGSLPPGYRVVHRLEIESQRILILLNLVGAVLLIIGLLVAWGVDQALNALEVRGPNVLQGIEPLLMAGVVLVVLVIILGLHELCHGLAFRLFGARVRYGFNLHKGVAFASADQYYLTRDAYLIVALAPLIVISILSVILMALTSGDARTVAALAGAANAGGAVGDLWFAKACLRFPRDLLVRDFGDGAELLMRD